MPRSEFDPETLMERPFDFERLRRVCANPQGGNGHGWPTRGRIFLTLRTAARFEYAGPPPELVRLRRGWFDSWAGIGRVAAGMARQSYDLQFTRYGEEGWRATFYPAGRTAHSATAVVGSRWAPTPWSAAQGAALVALVKAERARKGAS